MLSDMSTIPNLRVRRNDDDIPAAVTDVGCEREINEDRYAVIESPAGRAWVVCDGMGGALGGELAAQLAIDAMRRELENTTSGAIGDVLTGAIEEANRVIVLRRQNPAFSTMGTTIVAAMISGDEVVVSHVGDSRAYLVRGDHIQALTVDHTYVQDLVERGAIKPEEALSHPQAHVLTRCLGAEPRLDIKISKYWIWDTPPSESEDRLVLCSDGLYSLISDAELAKIISSRSPQESCIELVELAKERGGYDNITVTILPLGGQLREEARADGNKAKVVVNKNFIQKREVEFTSSVPISLEKRIAASILFAIMGGTLAFVWQVLFELPK